MATQYRRNMLRLFPLEAAVARALEAAAISHRSAAQTARARGDTALTKAEQRASNAAARGLAYWQAGIRPEMTETGNWLLPSQRAGEPPHLLWQDRERRWQCSCPAGASAHWAMAIAVAVEQAYDNDTLLPLPFDGEEDYCGIGEAPPITARLSAALDAAERALWPAPADEATHGRYAMDVFILNLPD